MLAEDEGLFAAAQRRQRLGLAQVDAVVRHVGLVKDLGVRVGGADSVGEPAAVGRRPAALRQDDPAGREAPGGARPVGHFFHV